MGISPATPYVPGRASGFTAAVVGWLVLVPSGLPAADASYVGEALCRGCHAVEATHWDNTPHARAFGRGPRTDLERRGCEGCHGPGSIHAAAPTSGEGILAFTRRSSASPAEQNAACAACHRGGPLLYWQGSVHERQGLACSDCHNPMAATSQRALLRETRASATCFGCHPQQRVEFRKRSHKPLFEGKLGCEDCHAPHGSNTDPLLKGDSANATCYGCHAEKRGPFLFEHAPVRESCLSCHKPHGSNHERLLTTARPFLCQQCHSQVGHPSLPVGRAGLSGTLTTDERLVNRSCTNCHAQIHGSNHPSGARFHR